MTLEQCFLCGRPVLELTGQFDKLDSFLLRPDDAAYAEGAYGWCHTACLITSRWAHFWAERRLEHLTQVVGRRRAAEAPPLIALRSDERRETIVLHREGLIWTLRDDELKRAQPQPGGVLLPVSHEYNLDLTGYDGLAEEIQSALVAERRFALPRLTAALGIADRMMFPIALEAGELAFERSLKRYWDALRVSARANYARFVPSEALELASEQARAQQLADMATRR